MDNKSIDNKSTFNEFMVNEFTVNNLKMPKKHLFIIGCYSSRCFVEFFKFAREHKIDFVYLSSLATNILQPLNVRIFKPLANVYFQ